MSKLKKIGQLNKGSQGQRIYDIEGESCQLTALGGGQGAKTGLYCVAQRGRGENNLQTLEARKDGMTNSLTSVEKDNYVSNDKRIRRLTPTECERLQGFSDGWTEGISDTQRYKCLGNAVSVPVVKAVMERLFKTRNF